MVRTFVDAWSGKCSDMKASPGRNEVSSRTGTSMEPRRELTRTTSPSATPMRPAGVHRRQAPALVPDLLGRGVTPVAAEAPGQLGDDVDVVAGPHRRFERLADALHPPLAVGDRAFRLGPSGGRREHDMRE